MCSILPMNRSIAESRYESTGGRTGRGGEWSGSERAAEHGDELGDPRFVAPVVRPLADARRPDEPGALQGRHVRRNGRLGEAQLLLDVADAHADLHRVG